MLEALLINFEERDVFVSLETSNQLRRLHAAYLASLPGEEAAAAAAAAAASTSASADGAQAKKAPLPPLPQLYANGTRIGGFEEMKQLDDEGDLGKLLEQYKGEAGLRAVDDRMDCGLCGNKRFVICPECNGSRKGRRVFANGTLSNAFLKCSHCNENGLVPCPECSAHVPGARGSSEERSSEVEEHVIESVAPARASQRFLPGAG